jgi:2-polyprenyl-3-methyl-5-hydroxy-6-metoxy-1,4-benzoquinol methylase
MSQNKLSQQEFSYDATLYAELGNFIKEKYLEYPFTHGTLQEVDFLEGEIQKGSRILDVGCGVGRHSLELARRGYKTVGVDITSSFIEIASRTAKAEGLEANFFVKDARRLEFDNEFDAAICLCEGAFGLAGDEQGHRDILKGVYRALRPGGMFILTAISGLISIRNADPKTYDPYTLTSTDVGMVQNPNGEYKEFTTHTTAFTYRELKWLLQDADFEIVAACGCGAGNFVRKPLNFDDIEIMMIAKKGT